MNLWLDDMRPAPLGWEWCTTVPCVRLIILGHDVENLSLDNDLGKYETQGQEVVKWLIEKQDSWPKDSISVHSANPVAAKVMCDLIERYGPYEYRDYIDFTPRQASTFTYPAIRYSREP